MEVIAAINLYNGQCIDTLQDNHRIVKECNPIDYAKKWNNIGANWIHLTDVNSIKENILSNINIIKEIIPQINTNIQVAARIDNLDLFEDILAAGADRIVLDNAVLINSDFIKKILGIYPEKAVIFFNVDSGMTDIGGHHEHIIDVVNQLKQQGLTRIIYHDISKNHEFNYNDLIDLSKETHIPIIASGKLKTLNSIKKLKQSLSCIKEDLEGIILSKPLYDKTVDLYEVIKLIEAYPYIGDFYSREDIC